MQKQHGVSMALHDIKYIYFFSKLYDLNEDDCTENNLNLFIALVVFPCCFDVF